MGKNSIEFLINSLEHLTGLKFEGEDIINQAKQMHKQEIFDAWKNGFREFYDGSSTPEQYYRETYEEK